MIEILSDTALLTIQDLGRTGALSFGVGTSGAMDPLALIAGNLLVGNERGAAAIEAQIFPLQIRFDRACTFAVTGADCAAQLDGEPLMPWWCGRAEPGQVLRLGVPRKGAWRGSRAYLCVGGGIDVPEVLGSRSTQLRGAFGGHEGRTLRKADRLAVGADRGAPTGFGILPPGLALPLERDGLAAVRVLPAGEFECFKPTSREALWCEPWTITPQSDRYGYRLAGPNLEAIAPIEMRSHGIVPGVIQVPPGGQPIVQMRDAQPSGGYPKVGTVIEADLWRLGQMPIGTLLRFVECSWDEALTASKEIEHWTDELARLVALHRLQSESRR